MTNTSKLTAVFAASAIGLATMLPVTAFAQVTGSIPSSDSSAAASGDIGADSFVPRGLPSSPLVIKRIDALEGDAAQQFENISQAQLATTQQELQSNPALVSELRAKGVQLNNVVEIQTFPNGGILVYLR